MSTRRQFVRTAASAGGVGLVHHLLPPWAMSAQHGNAAVGLTALHGPEFDLEINHQPIVIDGRKGEAIALNGHVPAPLLHWREGDEITLHVTNRLEHDSSIHWHGILVPFPMDGVPGVTFPGIKPGETFTYRFAVNQNGTYWYHSHSGLQEQSGHYGPIIIEPNGADPVAADREYIVVLSDWTFADPHRIFSKLKKMSESFNFQKRTVGTFFRDAAEDGLGSALKNRAMWGRMQMGPTDIADVTGAAYTYLVNGHAPADNWTALFEPGERVRLRIINASAMTIFDVRIPGLPLTVVQADGLNVRPVETDEFQIGVAETYDVVVQPERPEAFTLMCETIDRSGYARATLAPRAGMEGKVPPLRPRPLLTMKDMGMAHGEMGHGGHGSMGAKTPETSHAPDSGMPSVNPTANDHQHGPSKAPAPQDPHAEHNHGTVKAPTMDPHSGHQNHGAGDSSEAPDHGSHGNEPRDPHAEHDGRSRANSEDHTAIGAMQRHAHPTGVGNNNLAMQPINRLDEPGTGLEDVPHRTLTYTMLSSLEPNKDTRPPGREIEIHLTGNMERFMWSFDGKKFSQLVDPIILYKGERARLTMVNDTMMAHPIHLHGMFFDVVNGEDRHMPRKHTIIVKPGDKLSVDVTAEAVGDWAFHCHLLYHMHAGMFQIVSVRESKTEVQS